MLDGLKFIASGGGHNAAGLQKFGDNNHYALVLLMVLPLIVYIYRYAASHLVRLMALSVFILTFLAMIATHSRGALVTIVVVGMWIILLGKNKIAGLLMAVVLSVLAFQLAPADWFERMDTIASANEDASFMGRVTAWKRASAIALENPILGGGYHAGQGGGEIFEQFRYKQGLLAFVETPDSNYPAASHSIYFQVLGDLGFIGLFLFFLCLLNVFYCRYEILKLVKVRGANSLWAEDLANLTAAGVIAFMVGGALLSAAYFELPYYLMMFMQCIKLALDERISS
jgi:probable O-glycosylation ligase (exosortase A-associated)